jgi:superfamily II DNA or RNA helicase
MAMNTDGLVRMSSIVSELFNEVDGASFFQPAQLSRFQLCQQRVQASLDNPKFTLFPHQKEALREVAPFFERVNPNFQYGIIVAPTGAGKSAIAALLPYILGSRRVLVITPSKTITEQLSLDFW